MRACACVRVRACVCVGGGAWVRVGGCIFVVAVTLKKKKEGMKGSEGGEGQAVWVVGGGAYGGGRGEADDRG